jgi:hypothetical protein
MEDAIRRSVSTGDCLQLKNNSSNVTTDPVIVEVISAGEDTISCHLYTPMTGEILHRFSLQPIMASLFPVTAQTNIIELLGMVHIISASRGDIIDIVFIVPVQELESGMVHITGACNLFFA